MFFINVVQTLDFQTEVDCKPMTDPLMSRLEFAKDLAQEAAALAVKLRDERDADFISEKGRQDFVTLADRAVERLIRTRIAETYPEDAMLGEEDGVTGEGEGLWVVDPIDGTANYMRGLPDWGVCIAYCHGDEILCGVVCAPDLNMHVWAAQGGGAWMNGAPIGVSDCHQPDRALLLLGWSNRRPLSDHLAIIGRVLEGGLEYRRNGSAAISLLAVATGRAEGYFEQHLNAWDAFAAMVIIAEAGGIVRAAPTAEFVTSGSSILASAPGLIQAFEAIIAET